MILPIVKYGTPVLRHKGKPVPAVDASVKKLIANMLETMRDAKGVGLAAQQVGHALQLAVIDITGVTERESKMWIAGKPVDPEAHMPVILINPEISGTKSKVKGTEGCLSFPGIGAEISRSQRVKVKTKTTDGKTFEFEAAGLLGRAVQHEYDHLHGKLFIDLMDAATRKELREEIQLLEAETKAAL
jgi:peptide deformylase